MPEVTLAIVEGPDAGKEVPLAGALLIGRGAGLDVTVEDPEVSTRHASFELGDAGAQVEDLGSTNGTFVNGERVSGSHQLRAGDRVQVGNTIVEIRGLEQAPAGTPTAAPAGPAVTRAREIPMLQGLVFTAGQMAGTEMPVGEQVVVGRDPGAADVVLDKDPDVSRRHAAFSPAGAGLVVQDLGSTNGTFVNGHRLQQAVTLTTGDRVQIGETVIDVRTGGAKVVEPAPAAPAAAAPTNDIVVEELAKEFDGHRAVDGISLRVNPGEVYGFLGPNGAGKSTTVEMLTTLLPPTSGAGRVAGFDVARESKQVRTVTGVALQAAALDMNLNAWEHMELQAALQGLPKSERRPRGQELLERVALTDAADRRVGGYSGGMKRRLDLALALVHHPSVLFLDEPTTGLDPESRNALWEEVARLVNEEGMTVFLTTQYLEEADVLADRVGIIDHGEIVAEGTPEALKAEIGRPTVEVTPDDDADWSAISEVLGRFGDLAGGAHRGVAVQLSRDVSGLAEVVRALDSAGLNLKNVELHAPSLDDVFLAKTGRSLDAAGEDEEEPEETALEQLNASGVPGAPSPSSAQ